MIIFTDKVKEKHYQAIETLLASSNDNIPALWLGIQEYKDIWNLQKFIHGLVQAKNRSGVILCLEHYRVYTLGRNANEDNLLDLEILDKNVVKTDRGGDVTYHGPGQLVGYPIINLNHFKKSITWYVDAIESSVISYLKHLKIKAKKIEGLTGVWVNDKKICALGVRISKWITMHGFALNFNTDIKEYDKIIPCGINHYGITSVEEEIGEIINVKDQASVLNRYICKNLEKGAVYEA